MTGRRRDRRAAGRSAAEAGAASLADEIARLHREVPGIVRVLASDRKDAEREAATAATVEAAVPADVLADAEPVWEAAAAAMATAAPDHHDPGADTAALLARLPIRRHDVAGITARDPGEAARHLRRIARDLREHGGTPDWRRLMAAAAARDRDTAADELARDYYLALGWPLDVGPDRRRRQDRKRARRDDVPST